MICEVKYDCEARTASAFGVRRIHANYRPSAFCVKDGNPSTRSGVQREGRREPAQARPKAKGQIFRFPRPCRLVLRGCAHRVRASADQVLVHKPLSSDLRNRQAEALRIIHRFPVDILPVVEAESLFVNVAEQVIGFDAHVGSIDSTLQEAPEVLQIKSSVSSA